jgi:hypothetical protein
MTTLRKLAPLDRSVRRSADLKRLEHQAKDLLRAVRRGDPAALAELQQHHPRPPANRIVVSEPAMRLIAERGGHR